MNKPLQKQIFKMVARDQAMRFSGVWNAKIDQKNTRALKAIIKKYGWPDIDLVGKKAGQGAFLLAQHADNDPKFQKLCLKLLTQKFEEHKVEPQSLAYLTDRVFVNFGKKQIYGTQFYFNKKTKKFGPRPIKDLKNLSKRRYQKKLGSFQTYSKLLHQRQNTISNNLQAKKNFSIRIS